jgi:hypothetical protein
VGFTGNSTVIMSQMGCYDNNGSTGRCESGAKCVLPNAGFSSSVNGGASSDVSIRGFRQFDEDNPVFLKPYVGISDEKVYFCWKGTLPREGESYRSFYRRVYKKFKNVKGNTPAAMTHFFNKLYTLHTESDSQRAERQLAEKKRKELTDKAKKDAFKKHFRPNSKIFQLPRFVDSWRVTEK